MKKSMAVLFLCAVATAAEERKLVKYTSLDHGHNFTLVSIETLGRGGGGGGWT